MGMATSDVDLVSTVPPDRVVVMLEGGTYDGSRAQAPRDDAGRILERLWIGKGEGRQHFSAKASPGDDVPLCYELASWRTEHPVYRWVPDPQ